MKAALNIRIDAGLHREVKIAAAEQNTTVTAIVELMLRHYLNGDGMAPAETPTTKTKTRKDR